MERKNNTGEDKEVYLTYTFNASRETVFKAWTDPEFLVQWFAPEGCTIEYKKIDIRKGGSYLSCVHTPHYGDCWCKGTYLNIVRPERIEFTMVVSDENGNSVKPTDAGMDPEWPAETLVTVILSEDDGKTTLTLRQTVSQELATKTGAYPSWITMMQRLEKNLI